MLKIIRRYIILVKYFIFCDNNKCINLIDIRSIDFILFLINDKRSW